MSLVAGDRIGPYEVLSPLGAGGMGEVYRAHDSRLGRDVALKVLPERFAADADRLARFQREAQLLASLNHPHIGSIYGLEESNGATALVLELIEGPTLADRIAHGALPLDETLRIARQIAEALAAAHERGVIHRDLKPANIKLTSEGEVKVLDFGLAKLVEREPAAAGLSMSPTLSVEATLAGVILGSAGYMSPEQARGRVADKRTDVWAFGCVVFEMLTGKRSFDTGDSVSDAVAAILKSEPDWRLLPAATPTAIRRLLRRCLAKDPDHRLHDMGDARLELDEPAGAPADSATVAPRAARRERLALVSALGLMTIVAAALGAGALRPAPDAPEIQLEIATPPTTDPVSLAISPDGRSVVFVASDQSRPSLWVRSLETGTSRVLPGTADAMQPFWSPDSRAIGFFADGRLKRVNLSGGVQILAAAPVPRGGAWGIDGTILFAGSATSPVLRMPSAGGTPVAVVPLAANQASQRFPQFLPDGRHYLFFVLGPDSVRGVYIGDLDGGSPRRLLSATTTAVYALPGYLLFVREGSLFAQRFDASGLTLSGDPFLFSDNVSIDSVSANQPAVSASVSGPIIYRPGSGGGRRRFVWVDRTGKELATPGEPHDGINPSLSQDERRVAVNWAANGNLDTWILDLARGAFTRSTSNTSFENYPVWSPDGREIAFSSNRAGAYDLYRKRADNSGPEVAVLSTPQLKNPTDWSRDGRFLLYRTMGTSTGYDLMALEFDGAAVKPGQPIAIATTEFEERDGVFSPDGRWVAYQSNESGRFEVYAQPFPGPGGRIQVSTNGGGQVRWARTGVELYYVELDGRLMAVPMSFDAGGAAFRPGAAVPLFMTRIGGAVQNNLRQQYAVSADGRFLMNDLVEEAAAPIKVLLNWKGAGP